MSRQSVPVFRSEPVIHNVKVAEGARDNDGGKMKKDATSAAQLRQTQKALKGAVKAVMGVC